MEQRRANGARALCMDRGIGRLRGAKVSDANGKHSGTTRRCEIWVLPVVASGRRRSAKWICGRRVRQDRFESLEKGLPCGWGAGAAAIFYALRPHIEHQRGTFSQGTI